MSAFLTDESRAALTQSIRTVEARSSVELVIAVEPRSQSYLAADLLVGSVVAFAVLLFLIFSPWPFAWELLALEPAVAGVVAGLISSRVDILRRWFSRQDSRGLAVRRAAKATFFEKGVRHTAGKSGVLVYASLLERQAVVLADSGVMSAIPAETWRELVRPVLDAVADGGDGAALAKAIAALAEPLGDHLPRSDDDVNELDDEVHG